MHEPSSLHFGDRLVRRKGPGVNHTGIYVGNCQVFHSSPEQGEHVSSWEEFAQGETVQVYRSRVDPQVILTRVRARLASPRPYHLTEANCEHSVTAVLEGNSSSSQLQVAVLFAGFAALFLYLGRA